MTASPTVENLGWLRNILNDCLGYAPERLPAISPLVIFEHAFTSLSDSGAERVHYEQREAVGGQLWEAYAWCADRFPLSIRRQSGEDAERSISEFIVGRSQQGQRLLSWSSPQMPGVVFLAADWPLRSPYRLASVIAHEGIHQALYLRELEAPLPVRRHSLAYSPWKDRLRPGRWVWHAFWTFTCQSALLAESVVMDRSLLEKDPTLLRFIADMAARVSVCLYALKLSQVVSTEELVRCDRAFSTLEDLLDRMTGVGDFRALRSRECALASGRFLGWSNSLLSDHVRSGVGPELGA